SRSLASNTARSAGDNGACKSSASDQTSTPSGTVCGKGNCRYENPCCSERIDFYFRISGSYGTASRLSDPGCPFFPPDIDPCHAEHGYDQTHQRNQDTSRQPENTPRM